LIAHKRGFVVRCCSGGTGPRPEFKHRLWHTETGHWLFNQLPVNWSL